MNAGLSIRKPNGSLNLSHITSAIRELGDGIRAGNTGRDFEKAEALAGRLSLIALSLNDPIGSLHSTLDRYAKNMPVNPDRAVSYLLNGCEQIDIAQSVLSEMTCPQLTALSYNGAILNAVVAHAHVAAAAIALNSEASDRNTIEIEKHLQIAREYHAISWDQIQDETTKTDVALDRDNTDVYLASSDIHAMLWRDESEYSLLCGRVHAAGHFIMNTVRSLKNMG